MLLDLLLACAPVVVVVVPAVVTFRTRHMSFTRKHRLQKRLLESLALAEKLPAGALGGVQIARDIDRQTLHLAYVAQYPHRTREIIEIALIGVGLVGALVVYYVLLWADAPLLYLLAFLALVVAAALWLERVAVNFACNDRLVRELFARLGAPEHLVRPRTELVLKAPVLTVDKVLEHAADVRDARHDRSMSTLDAVNSVLAQAHTHGPWRRPHRVVHLDHPIHTKATVAHGLTLTAMAYDWLLWHLLRPFFKLRLINLDNRERRRIARAEKAGDVYKAAWLATHYHNERHRLANHWAHLRRARDPLLRWSSNGSSPTAQPALHRSSTYK